MTRKGAILELLIVTVGVLIALSVDTVRDWRANEKLAEQARANILSEIRQNKDRLESSLKQLQNNRKGYTDTFHAANNVIAGKPHGMERIQLNYNMASLSSGAYDTAEITGAFGLMAYDDVRRFAGLYDMQKRYSALENEFINLVSNASAAFMMTDFQEMSRPELDAVKQGLQLALGSMTMRGQLGMLLTQGYNAILKEADAARAADSDE